MCLGYMHTIAFKVSEHLQILVTTGCPGDNPLQTLKGKYMNKFTIAKFVIPK